MRRHTKPPPKEEPPYPIKEGPLKELASKRFLELHKEKRFAGPFEPDEAPNGIFLSPIFVKEKDLKRNKGLVLMDYSAPKGQSINSEIPKSETYVPFPSIIFFIQLLVTFGPSAWIWVADLENAYYNVWIMKKYSKLFAISWLGKILIPFFMPFGIATGCVTLQKLLDIILLALEIVFPQIFCLNNNALTDHYLDDECGIAPLEHIAWLQCTLWLFVVSVVGLPFSTKKIQTPSKTVILLGFKISILTSSLALREDKASLYLIQVKFLIINFESATIIILQQLTGRLRHASRAIHGATAFVRGLEYQCNKMIAKNFPRNKKFTLSNESLHDLKFWSILLPQFNGIPFSYIVKDTSNITITLFTDASGSPKKGLGAWDTLGNFFSIAWSKTKFKDHSLLHKNYNNVLELCALCFSILRLRNIYKNKAVQVYCDNNTAVNWWIFKAPTFKIKYYHFVTYLIRYTTLHCIKNRIFIWVDYISTLENLRADGLSRLKENALGIPQTDFPQKIKFKFTNPIKIINKCFDYCKKYGWI